MFQATQSGIICTRKPIRYPRETVVGIQFVNAREVHRRQTAPGAWQELLKCLLLSSPLDWFTDRCTWRLFHVVNCRLGKSIVQPEQKHQLGAHTEPPLEERPTGTGLSRNAPGLPESHRTPSEALCLGGCSLIVQLVTWNSKSLLFKFSSLNPEARFSQAWDVSVDITRNRVGASISPRPFQE